MKLVLAGIPVLVAYGLILFLAVNIGDLKHKTDATNKRLVATMNCFENTAYTRSMLDQCIQDYYDSRGW